jgi:hypothetical protein
MKNFREWRHEANLFDGSNLSETDFAHLKECYDAGAEEKLKSLRCETCKYYDNEGHDKPSCSNHETPVGFVAFSKKFGCIHHKQKEGE